MSFVKGYFLILLIVVKDKIVAIAHNQAMKLILVLAVAFAAALALPARAQFRPCLWPNTCGLR